MCTLGGEEQACNPSSQLVSYPDHLHKMGAAGHFEEAGWVWDNRLPCWEWSTYVSGSMLCKGWDCTSHCKGGTRIVWWTWQNCSLSLSHSYTVHILYVYVESANTAVSKRSKQTLVFTDWQYLQLISFTWFTYISHWWVAGWASNSFIHPHLPEQLQ